MEGVLGKNDIQPRPPEYWEYWPRSSRRFCAPNAHLGNVLQLIIDGFYDGSLSKQELVGHPHQGSFHVVLQFGYQLYPVHKETLEQVLTDIFFVTDKFAIELFHECLVVQWFSVVNIPGCNQKFYNSPFITDQMKFEAEEPSHGAFASRWSV